MITPQKGDDTQQKPDLGIITEAGERLNPGSIANPDEEVNTFLSNNEF